MAMRRLAGIAALLVLAGAAPALQSAPEPVLPAARPWTARWITVPDSSPTAYGVYLFRRSFSVPAVPSAFRVHVSADNRYQLFVNGTRVASGPARGDLFHWRYETVDLAPHLRPGTNVLAAIVWNYGPGAAESQVTNETGFLLQGDGPGENGVDSGPNGGAIATTPRAAAADARGDPQPVLRGGAGREGHRSRHPWGWETATFDDAAWKPARAGTAGQLARRLRRAQPLDAGAALDPADGRALGAAGPRGRPAA